MRPFHVSVIVVFCASDNAIKEVVLHEKELRLRRQLYRVIEKDGRDLKPL